MPSTLLSDRLPPVVLLVAVLAVLAVTVPATAVATDGPGARADSSAPAGDRGDVKPGHAVADDRSACPRASGSSAPGTATGDDTTTAAGDQVMPSTDAPPRVPNESEDRDVALGDVAVVPLSVPAGENATVVFGSGDGFTARLAVRDDGDGRVTLLVNTYLAGGNSTVAPGTYRVRGDDEVSVVGGETAATLHPDEYAVTVRRDGTVLERRQVIVAPPEVEGIAVRRAVPQVFDAANASEIRAANRSGLIQPLKPGEHEPEVVAGETLVLRFDAPSMLGAIAAQPGNTTTERFLALHGATDPATPETFEIMGLCGGIMVGDSADAGAVRVVTDYQNGVVYVLLDTDDVEGVTAGEQTAWLELDPQSRLVDGADEVEVRAEFGVADRTVTVDSPDENAVQLADGEVEIAGETNLLPGTRITVHVSSRVDPTFDRRTTATVAENGTFSTAVDLSGASDPGLFAVTVAGQQFPGRIGTPPTVYWELDNSGDSYPVDKLWVQKLDLPEDGFLVAYRYDAESGRFHVVGRGATSYVEDLPLEPVREPTNLLVVAHRDGNGNGEFDGPAVDQPYRVDGRPVSDWVGVAVDGREPPVEPPAATFDPARVGTPTVAPRTPTSTPIPTPASPPPTAGSPTNAPDGTPADAPGFGPVVALVTLLGAAAVAARRQ